MSELINSLGNSLRDELGELRVQFTDLGGELPRAQSASCALKWQIIVMNFSPESVGKRGRGSAAFPCRKPLAFEDLTVLR
ncbi:MAG TPA: hypothetical protein VIV66_04965 [Pyrinomonadaceae bacterium]